MKPILTLTLYDSIPFKMRKEYGYYGKLVDEFRHSGKNVHTFHVGSSARAVVQCINRDLNIRPWLGIKVRQRGPEVTIYRDLPQEWLEYEKGKAELERLGLPPKDFEREIRKLANALKI